MADSADDNGGRSPITLIPGDEDIGVTGLTAASLPPPAPPAELEPEALERYVLAGVHHDRSPGNLLVVQHPFKRNKVPRGLLAALTARGFTVEEVETHRDATTSVKNIREAMLRLSDNDQPLDLMVVSGDGSLDHHVLVAAYSAFYPELVVFRPGRIDCSEITDEQLLSLPADVRNALYRDGVPSSLKPTQETITAIWLARMNLESAVLAGAPLHKLGKAAGLDLDDPVLAVAVLAARWPDRVDLVPDHFDLAKLAHATMAESFQGLYPYIRAIACYPAGVAADNAVFAGVPGWGFATAGNFLARWSGLDYIRRKLEARTTRAFVDYFCDSGVVVPARLSVLALDGHWRAVCGHVVSGPAGGHFFTKDLTRKTQHLFGYLQRIPAVILKEGVFGRTHVRVRSYDSYGEKKSHAEGHLAEGLYTNRTYVAGVASVPTTNPTSFAGESSLLVVPPVWSRQEGPRSPLNLRGLLAFSECIAKGMVARALHFFGVGTGTLAGGGRVWGLRLGSQVAIKEGERIRIDYQHLDHKARGVPVVISGDPFQAYRMDMRVLWGPIPMLGGRHSLLVDGVRRSLTNLRLERSYDLEHTYIGGVRYFRHRTGMPWNAEMTAKTGLFLPPLHLPRSLDRASNLLRRRWQAAGAGEFVDTSKPGLPLVRRGSFAHNNDQSAHLLVLKEGRGTVLVRLVRVRHDGGIYETRTHYRIHSASYIIHRSQTIHWIPDEPPRILREAHYFRDAEVFQQQAASFLPVAGERTVDVTDSAVEVDVSPPDPSPGDDESMKSVAGPPESG